MSSRPPSPPWIPEALLWLSTRRDDWRATVIGDLREEYAQRAARGRVRATLWYWAEAMRLLTSGVRRLGVRRGPFAAVQRAPRGALVREVATDIRLALRLMRRQPALTAVAVLTLTLGIGSTAVIFNLLDTLVLRVMDLPGDDRLVMLTEQRPSTASEDRATAPGNYLDWRDASSTFSFVGAFDTRSVNVADAAGAEHPERRLVTAASAGMLEAMGVKAQLGRLIEASDDAWGAPAVAVLSDTVWRVRFAASPSVVGRTLLLDERPHTIVGVTPPSFAFPRETAAWVPLSLPPDAAADRVTRSLQVVARLREGVSLEAARAEAGAIAARLQTAFPETNRSVGVAVTPLAAAIRDEAAPAMIAVWQTAAVFVLLIACVNVAQLLLARGRGRRREFMVRVSLGAGLGRLARQLLIEGLVLATAAGVLALGIGWVALRAIKASLPPELMRLVAGWELIGLDGRMVLFTCAIAAVSAALFSVLPVLQAARVDLADGLKQGGRSQAGDGGQWHRGLLTAGQIAGALMLTVGTALAVRGASDLLHGEAGFDDTRVVVASVALPEMSYGTADARREFHDRAIRQLAEAAGILDPALVNVAPSALRNASRPVFVDRVPVDSSDVPRADYRVISPSYFDALRIPILAGRPLRDTDRHDARPVAVVSRSMASRFWPGTDPLGQRFRQRIDGEWITVVGVAGDVVHHWFNRRQHPTFYRPYAQDPQELATVVARVDGDPLAAVPALRDAVAAIDSRLPLYDATSLARMREVGLTGLTFLVRIMTVLCVLAVALASVGIYAAVSHGVTTRRREIGLRVALGARPGRIVGDVARQVVIVTLVGVVVGGGGALLIGKLMASVMFGLIALEAGVYASVAAGLAAVAMAAGLLPARAALAVDPATALRAD